jgi:hypothetical protein
MVMVSRLNKLSSPMENVFHRGQGRSWALSDTPNLSGVERKSKQERMYLRV